MKGRRHASRGKQEESTRPREARFDFGPNDDAKQWHGKDERAEESPLLLEVQRDEKQLLDDKPNARARGARPPAAAPPDAPSGGPPPEAAVAVESAEEEVVAEGVKEETPVEEPLGKPADGGAPAAPPTDGPGAPPAAPVAPGRLERLAKRRPVQGLSHEAIGRDEAAAPEEKSLWDQASDAIGAAYDYVTGNTPVAAVPPPVTIGSADWWVTYKGGAEATRQQLALSAWRANELQAHIDALNMDQTTHLAEYQDELGEVLDYLQQFEMMRAAGMTWEEMAAEQGTFMATKDKADAEAKHGGKATDAQIAEARQENLTHQDYISEPDVTEFSKLSDDEQAKWAVRGAAAVTRWVAHINATRPELGITEANVILAFEEVEAAGASAYTHNDGNAYIGRDVVLAIERDPAYADSTCVHEIVGHREFDSGFSLSLELYDASAATDPGYLKPVDGSGERKAELQRFEYFESEMGALMRESTFWVDSRDVGGDGTIGATEQNPLGDPEILLDVLLNNMADQFAPSLRAPYAKALVKRFEADPRIPDEANTMLRDGVTRIMGVAL